MRRGGCEEARVIVVVETKAHRGTGDADNPHRMVTQYWTTGGDFLAERDRFHETLVEDKEKTP
jgi:hypothetical protein